MTARAHPRPSPRPRPHAHPLPPQVNIGSTSTGGRIQAVKADLAKILLTAPVCTAEGEKIALSRRVDKHWRLIGWGEINRGLTIEPSKP